MPVMTVDGLMPEEIMDLHLNALFASSKQDDESLPTILSMNRKFVRTYGDSRLLKLHGDVSNNSSNKGAQDIMHT
jgi:hypothetical protein